MSAWYTKPLFLEHGLVPYLQPVDSNNPPETCAMCLEDIAFENPTSTTHTSTTHISTTLTSTTDTVATYTPTTDTSATHSSATDAVAFPQAHLSDAEKAFLEALLSGEAQPLDIISLRKEQPRAVKDPEHAGIKIKACGHVFGLTCLHEWLKEKNACPMCRKMLFGGRRHSG